MQYFPPLSTYSPSLEQRTIASPAIYFPTYSATSSPEYLQPRSFSLVIHQEKPFPSYHSSKAYEPILASPHPEYHFLPDQFLKPGKGGTFVGKAEEIRFFVEEAFLAIYGEPFPDDFKISVLDTARFRQIAPHPETIGLSFNRRKWGLLSEIFVLEGSLGRVLLTIGHELGHVLTDTLENAHDEEAKAYAFSLVWMKAIQEKNIAGLGNAFISELPAENGLHNVAFRWVQGLVKNGMELWELYREIVEGRMGVVM